MIRNEITESVALIDVRMLKKVLTLGATALSLYMFYVLTSHRQQMQVGKQMNQIKATSQYVMTGLGWGKKKFFTAKKQLVEAGLIETVTKRNQEGQIIASYIRLQSSVRLTRTPADPDGGFRGTINTDKNNISTDKNININTEAFLSDFETYIATFNSMYGKSFRNTPDRFTKYKSRRKTYSAQDILTALHHLNASEWHRENWSPDPELLIRNDSHVDKWLNTVPVKKKLEAKDFLK